MQNTKIKILIIKTMYEVRFDISCVFTPDLYSNIRLLGLHIASYNINVLDSLLSNTNTCTI